MCAHISTHVSILSAYCGKSILCESRTKSWKMRFFINLMQNEDKRYYDVSFIAQKVLILFSQKDDTCVQAAINS